MNYDKMKFLGITMFLWIGFPLSATAAEADAGISASAPAAAGTSESTPAVAGTSESAPAAAGTSESTPAVAGTSESAPVAAGASQSAPAAATTSESAPAAGTGERAKVEVGTRTTQWLDAQREGRMAGNPLPIPGAEAGLSYRRYINSFSKPIPDQLLPDTSVSSMQK